METDATLASAGPAVCSVARNAVHQHVPFAKDPTSIIRGR